MFNGGGNFGDLYRFNNRFRDNIIRLFPNNTLLIFPQTIFYKNISLAEIDNQFLSTIPNLSIAVRGLQSFEFAKRSFPKNNIVFVPDMSFMLGDMKPRQKPKVDILILRRTDSEKKFILKQWDILKKNLSEQNVSYSVFV